MGFKKICFLLSASVLLMNLSVADDAYQKAFEGMGVAINLHYILGDKNAKLFIAGNKVAQVGLGNGTKVIEISSIDQNGNRELLRFSPQAGYYKVETLPSVPPPYTLVVKTKIKNKEEHIKINVQPGVIH
ncbi:MAG: hypothetical protein KA715_09360 [Xanthomonadaceae bacterium]|nr:hypothetical protein [Xanthomonadaceae bacterium]